MATLTVSKFPTADGANQALGILEDLQRQHLIVIQDAAIVTWPQGDKKPRTRNLSNLAGAGALDGAFWGLLFGLIFFVPLLGAAVGAAAGALAGRFTDIGISDDFIREVRAKVTPGTSALFLLSRDAVVDRVVEPLRHLQPELIASNLSNDQEAKLKDVFAAQAETRA